MIVKDWTKYKNFTKQEFDCKHTGKNEMQVEFLEKLQKLRDVYARPMRISSGYRDRSHPVERNKIGLGPHAQGLACDVAVSGKDAYDLVALAMLHGFTGIGVNQKGGSRFIHLDIVKSGLRPTIWSY
jgi:zinc D-Ala-D-Ala carboxypeptidase